MQPKKRIALISTGGTIEKTYDELKGVLDNRTSVLDVLLTVGSSRVDLQACKLEYSIVSPK